MKILKRYLTQEIVNNILLVMFALLAMFSFFDLIQELESVGKGSYGIDKVLIFVILSAPGHVYEVVPVAVLVGTMYALGQLSRSSELVVMRTSGVSIESLTLSLLKIGLMFTLLTLVVGELITPFTEKTAQRIRMKATDSVVAQDFRSGLWVKDANNFVNVEEVLPDSSLNNIHIYEFDQAFKLKSITNAKDGIFNGKDWILSEVTQTELGEKNNRINTFSKAQWKSVIRPDLLNILLVSPEKMSIWNLYSYIHHLSNNKQKTTRHQIALWSKLVYPMACLVMVVLALPFGFLRQREGGASVKIFAGIMLGVSYQVLNRLFGHLGLLNDWSTVFSAITPTLLYLGTGVLMLIWVEKH